MAPATSTPGCCSGALSTASPRSQPLPTRLMVSIGCWRPASTKACWRWRRCRGGPEPPAVRGVEGLWRVRRLNGGQGQVLQARGGDRAQVRIDAPALPGDEERLRHAVHAPFDGAATVGIDPDRRKRVAVAAKKAAGGRGLILVVDAEQLDPRALLERGQDRMLLHAGQDRKSVV